MQPFTEISDKPWIVLLRRETNTADRLDTRFFINSSNIKRIKERHPDIDWIEVATVAEIKQGQSHDLTDSGDFRVLKVRHMMTDGTLNFQDDESIDKTTKPSKALRLKNNDCLLPVRGASTLLGKFCRLTSSDEKLTLDNNSAYFRIRLEYTERIDPEFFHLFFKTDIGRLQIQAQVQDNGGVLALTKGGLSTIQFGIPDKKEQGLILSRYFSAKKLLEKILSKSEGLLNKRKSVSKSLSDVFGFGVSTTRLPESDCWEWKKSKDNLCLTHTANRKCAILSSTKIEDRIDVRYHLPNLLRERVATSPSAWTTIGTISSVARETGNIVQRLPYVAIDEMPNDPWSSFETTEAIDGSAALFDKGDIGVSRLLPTISNGKCFLAWRKMAGSPEFISIKPLDVASENILFWVKSEIVQDYLTACVRGSSASQKRFTSEDLSACPIPIDIWNESLINRLNEVVKAGIASEEESYSLNSIYLKQKEKVEENIFSFLDDDFFNDIISDLEEALQ
jgi:hypothetical protein